MHKSLHAFLWLESSLLFIAELVFRSLDEPQFIHSSHKRCQIASKGLFKYEKKLSVYWSHCHFGVSIVAKSSTPNWHASILRKTHTSLLPQEGKQDLLFHHGILSKSPPHKPLSPKVSLPTSFCWTGILSLAVSSLLPQAELGSRDTVCRGTAWLEGAA